MPSPSSSSPSSAQRRPARFRGLRTISPVNSSSSSMVAAIAFLASALASILATTPSGMVAAEPEESTMPLFAYALNPPFVEENLRNRWWEFGGDTLVEVNRFVRLAPDFQSRRGWIYAATPLMVPSWLVEFEFKVDGSGSSLYGDGFAFWFTSTPPENGPVFGSKDYFDGLGIFFDTYSNGRHRAGFPYIMGMVNNGSVSYDNGNDGMDQAIGGCTSEIRKRDVPTRARIRYLAHTSLELSLDVKGNDQFETCFKADDVSLPSKGYIGFSSHTGDASDNHDILRVTTSSILNAKTKPPPQPKNAGTTSLGTKTGGGHKATPTLKKGTKGKPKSTSSGPGIVTVLIILLLVAGGGLAGFLYYQRRVAPKAYKRF
ncbi:legume-like lectin family-domain-containing protein [Zopfochytrium polystomum]|nr:legume-like lectin family-domain-containing protein [Zopfochytrium polystomum]